MALTAAQMALVKAHITASGDMNTLPNTSDGAFAIAALFNLPASPSFTVWKNIETLANIGKAFNATELAGMSTLNNTRLQTLAQYLTDGVNPSIASNRQFFDDVFSGAGGVNTRAALLILWKRLATRVEKVLATGTGSDASPATMGFVGAISYQDVEAARNS